MKKGVYVFAIVGLLVLAGGAAIAHQSGPTAFQEERMVGGVFHEQMEELMESGDYADLKALREETGFPLARMIDSQEDFEAMRARHEEMDAEGMNMQGMMQAHRGGDCPMKSKMSGMGEIHGSSGMMS